jgi:hypothetical protein
MHQAIAQEDGVIHYAAIIGCVERQAGFTDVFFRNFIN